MNQNIYDARLQHWLRAEIQKLPYSQQLQLKSIKLCNTVVNPKFNAVFLLRNNHNEAKLHGQVSCKNPWICPHCSSIIMAKYAREIGSGLDAMREQGYFGFMMTLTIPHDYRQSCRDVTDILYKTWRLAFANAFKKRKGVKSEHRWMNAFNQFFVENDMKHYVRCAEYTWSKANGWHPHFHCIFWVKRNRADKILSYEEAIRNAWLKAYSTVVKKYNYSDSFKNYLIEMIDRSTSQGLHISKNEDGSISESLSSDYIAGWGANKEATGNYKKSASHEGHLTPYQILDAAANGDNVMKGLYIEFMLQATQKPVHHRVNFSKTGLKKIIKDYININGYKDFLQKKRTEQWVVLCSFTLQEWSKICFEDRQTPIISNILYLAAFAPDLLEDFLLSFGIKLAKCPHPLAENIQNMYNKAA